MATLVLVHPGFAGGWVWRDVAADLRRLGHDVFTPTLTGLGERAHLASPNVDLDTHVQDVVGVLECEDLHRVVLVGSSSGSMAMTGAAERVPERLARLVYVDTLVPADGQSWMDLLTPAVATPPAGSGQKVRRRLAGATHRRAAAALGCAAVVIRRAATGDRQSRHRGTAQRVYSLHQQACRLVLRPGSGHR